MKNFLHALPKLLFLTTILGSVSPPLAFGQELASAQASPSQRRPRHLPVTFESKSLKEILFSLENVYHVSFNYDDDVLRDAYLKENFVWNKNEKIEKILDRLLVNFQMSYKRIDKGNFLILSKRNDDNTESSKGNVSPTVGGNFQQTYLTQGLNEPMASTRTTIDFTVSGVVTSDDGETLPGVNILLKGTSKGTTSDANGRYTLILPDAEGVLVFSFIGYTTLEEAIGNRSTIDVKMAADTKTLSEVIVVGYGSQENKDVTGAVGAINGSKLTTSAVPSVDQALQGRMSGVYVTSNSGEPGGGLSMRVRGMGGLGVSEPLYVIDGVIITYNASSSYGYKETANNPLATLNMADIESISVLKDASASAIYGARAGNGVVIITTKRGKSGAPRLSYEGYYGVQTVAKTLDIMDASEYAAYSNDARTAAALGTNPKFSNPASLGKGTDWQNAIFRSAPIQNHQLTLSGGSDNSQYYISAGYMKQDGIILGSSFSRYSLRLNLDNKVTSWLKIGNSLTLSRSFNQSLTNNNGDRYAGIVAQALRRSPTLGIRNADGSWAGPDNSDLAFVGVINNPVMLATLNNEPNERLRALENFNVEIKLQKNLTFRTNLGVDYVLTNYNRFKPTFVEGALSNNKPEATSTKSTLSNLLAENTLTYAKTFNAKHKLEVLGGYTAQLSTSDVVSALSFFQLTNDLTTIDAGSPNPDRQASGSKSQTSYVSLLGRVNYSFADKYLLTANIRRDGSSVFTSQNKYGVFPSFSAGWRISEENFMKGTRVSNLKLRASWGQVGIDGSLGIGTEYATIGSGYKYNFGGKVVNGMTANRVPNTSLKWETVTQTDIGLDFGLFDNRLNFTADYFVKNYEDMITDKRMPIYAGMVSDAYYTNPISQPINSANVQNKGIELAVSYQNRTMGGFGYTVEANMTTFSNKVITLADDIVAGYTGNSDPGYLTRTKQGGSIGEFYGYVADGIFHNQAEVDAANALDGNPTAFYQTAGTAPGDIKYKDIDGDNKITDKDRTYLGSPIPNFAYGFSTNFDYKGFSLNMLWQGVHGNKIVNVNRYILESSTDGENKGKGMVGRWTETNPSSNFPRAISTDPNNNDRASDRFIENGAYLRLKNIQLGYTLPANVTERLHLSNIKVYVSAQNLWTITKYSGYNPDIGAQTQNNTSYGIDNTVYPNSVTFLGGINIGL
ncbi:MAG TPA: SusC/RagA family TonB-linked outer membrane protein [Chryseolinea sp.]